MNASSINFVDEIKSVSKPILVTIDKIDSSMELLHAYNDQLKFPYFGFNWDALDECLRDLSWISHYEITIFHHKVPNLQKKELEIYLHVLYDAILLHEIFHEHRIYVYFPQKNKEQILFYWDSFKPHKLF